MKHSFPGRWNMTPRLVTAAGRTLLVTGIVFFSARYYSGIDTNQASDPIISCTEGLEDRELDQIKSSLKAEYPYVAALEQELAASVRMRVDECRDGFAYGRYSTGKSITSDSPVWFAKKTEDDWVVFNTSSWYFGACQDFWQIDFPADMIPDCWDTERMVLIETAAPGRFFSDGFDQKDKAELKEAFIRYLELKRPDVVKHFQNGNFFISVDLNTENHFKGRILLGGSENYSTPFILAAKVDKKWQVVYQGQEAPHCDVIDQYVFPRSIVPTCYVPDTSRPGNYFIEKVRFF